MTKLQLADGLAIPLEIVTERSAFIGRTGQGKSYAAQKLAELLHAAGAQFVVLDPVGIWWGLRLAANGKDPGLEIPVFGGLHGDLPLEPTAGKVFADLAADGRSMVLDVSGFEHDTDRARFAKDFAERFFFRKKSQPSAVLLFLEEGQEFVPQDPGRDENYMLRAFTRLAKIGRNFGVGISLITQRPQEVSKKVLNLTELLFAFQLNGKHERTAVEKWIEDKAIDEDIGSELPKLERWHPHAWSPSWLKISKVVRILPRATFDASSTPKVGKGAGAVKQLGPIDIDAIKKQMASTIEKAKAEDPKELRRRIAELEKQARAKAPALQTSAKVEVKRVEVPVLKDPQIKRLEGLAERFAGAGQKLSDTGIQLIGAARDLVVVLGKLNGNGHRPPPVTSGFARASLAPGQRVVEVRARPLPEIRVEKRKTPAGDEPQLASAQRKLLAALAFLEQVGEPLPDKTQVALFADLSPTAGHTGNMLGGLRSAGLIEYPRDGHVRLTDAGRAIADPGSVPQTPEAMQDHLYRKLPSAAAKLLKVLVAAYPETMTREAVASFAELSPTAGHTGNMFGHLRSLGLIDYPDKGTAVALPVLFLEAH